MKSSKIHFHSDCSFFAGCENMLPAFFQSAELKDQYDITFSYRFSKRYFEGLNQRIDPEFVVYPLSFSEIYDFSLLPSGIPLQLRRIYFLIARIVFFIPLLMVEIWTFYRLMKRIKPDVLHINNGGYPAALSARAAAIAGKIAKVPTIIMVVNNMAVEYNIFFRWLDYPVDRLVVSSVNKFVTGSKAASERLKKVLQLSPDKALSIYNGISYVSPTVEKKDMLQQLGLDNFEGVIFGIVGLLMPRKGHRILLEAAIKLANLAKDKMAPFKIVIVGDGGLRTDLENFAIENGISDYCIFTGQQNDVMNYMAIFDVLILSSIENEDFPFVILEAMSQGKPIIASKVAGTIEQVIHRQTGILVNPGDPDQLASAMHELACSEGLRKKMGEASHEHFLNNFTSEISISKYLSLYSG